MNVICIVQARMGSERLPGKVIKPILGKPMILYTLDRLSKSRYIDKLILATSEKEEEEPLVNVCRNAGYEVFRGDESNVLKRYKDAVDYYVDSDDELAVVRVTGDCPLIDPIIVDNVITHFMMNDYDYVRLDVPDSFIRGFDVEVFSRDACNKTYDTVNTLTSNVLLRSEEEKIQIKMYSEHVTYYMYKHEKEFKVGYVNGEGFYNKNYRLCVDTEDDFKLVENIINKLKNKYFLSKDVIEYLDNNEGIANLNKEVVQKNQ
ncbi:3-deoxy-manno-octulosonate cytidylyltransferase [Clostridium botulinum]|uniref:cytidylyltransferase domain-containing protein n=1 Tax=unclassified Clostridium TaxID=2614128 RepID=UPI000505FCEE|nr:MULTISPECIES: glycosyltransferase family protein [unclassified Clostridium]KAI3348218.1 glycosyltransferase family protein [Clostridium botulinum]KFX54763.1 3-deoxy-manno-octulosonate cytidylyltransferase [Clostridium botulinum]KFX58795.1 3-deoxy-manno-octulosonate cytidylyltransferase [Clostridium botulinum]KON12949.1 3-deoxy-manno-octulosonate cytidylyltransferase [Clostridium botulinum]MBY6779764.1 glycosyltransferase family protein [Clostridium botulinum]